MSVVYGSLFKFLNNVQFYFIKNKLNNLLDRAVEVICCKFVSHSLAIFFILMYNIVI